MRNDNRDRQGKPHRTRVNRANGLHPPGWTEHALCADLPPERRDVFFPSKGESTKTEIARGICSRCPVDHDTCIAYGNTVARDYGIFGGLAPGQRRQWAALRSGQERAA